MGYKNLFIELLIEERQRLKSQIEDLKDKIDLTRKPMRKMAHKMEKEMFGGGIESIIEKDTKGTGE